MKMKQRLRLILICLLVINVYGCNQNAADKPKPVVEAKSKPLVQKSTKDLHKAALLNVEMGEAYLAQGQVTRAKQKFMHALELKPKLPEAHSSFGYFYESVGDATEAEVHYKKAISYSDKNKGKFYNNYGTFLCRQGRFREADKAFKNAIADKQYIKTAEAFENAGLCALKQPNEEKALEYLRTALRRDHQRYRAALELAQLEFQKNNYLVAKDYLNRYKSMVDHTSRSLWLEVQINNKLGNKNEAASAALKLKSLFPKSEEYRQYIENKANG